MPSKDLRQKRVAPCYSLTLSRTLPGPMAAKPVIPRKASRTAPSVVACVMITSGTKPPAFFGRFMLDDRGDGDLVAAKDAGDFGHHAGPVLDVEADVEAAGDARPDRELPPRASRSSDQSLSVRKVIAARPKSVSIRSATQAEAVGIWPAPKPVQEDAAHGVAHDPRWR